MPTKARGSRKKAVAVSSRSPRAPKGRAAVKTDLMIGLRIFPLPPYPDQAVTRRLR